MKLPYETFEEIEAADKANAKVDILKNNADFAMRTILQLNFNDNIKLDLPEGSPPYREDDAPAGLQIAPISKQVTILTRLTPESKTNPIKKETMFIRLLESVHSKDAKIIIAAKDGKLEELYPSVTKALIKKTFPKLL